MDVKFNAKLSGGRLHIPTAIREAYNLKEGTKYECIIIGEAEA